MMPMGGRLENQTRRLQMLHHHSFQEMLAIYGKSRGINMGFIIL
jgi:hypothetical protein